MNSRVDISEAGFTIQELLVVLMVGSLLVSFSLSLLLFAGKLYSSWESGTEMRRSVHRAVAWLSSDFRKGSDARWEGDSTLVIKRRGGQRIRYLFTEGSVTRDSLRVAAPSGIALHLIKLDSTRILIRAKLREKSYTATSGFRIPRSSVSEIKKELNALRESSAWEVSKKR